MSTKNTTKRGDPNKSNRIYVKHRELLSNQWARLEDVEFDYLRSDGVWQTHNREIRRTRSRDEGRYFTGIF